MFDAAQICWNCASEAPGLKKCTVCHRYACPDCCVSWLGHVFCSKVCSHAFFVVNEDGEIEGEDAPEDED
jgi:hypothetical protein